MRPPATLSILAMALMGCAHQQDPLPREDLAVARSQTVASFSGPFTLQSRVKGVLYIVSDGRPERICSHTMMRSPNAISIGRPPDEPWRMTVNLFLTNAPAQNGRTTYSLY